MINIGGDAQDASYRYKMPKLVTKIEGRGNGIKTVIVNMVDIAKALHCDPGYPTKFFGIELGAQSKFNKKDERAIVNGAHQQPDMAGLLTKFIDGFVLCPTCKLPEMKLKVKGERIKIDCAACGHNGILNTTHKLTTYILKNPPKKKGAKTEKEGKKNKKDKKKKNKKKDRDEEQAAEEAPEGEVAEEEKGEKEKKKKKKEEEEEWFTDTSKEAQQRRKEEEFAEMQQENAKTIDSIMSSAKADSKLEAPETILKIFLASRERNAAEITSELKRLQLARGLDDVQKVKHLLAALIDTNEPKTVVTQFKKHHEVLKAVAKDKAQGLVLIGCLEDLVGVVCTALLVRTPMIMQALYDTDVLDEDTILEWADSPPESSWLVNKEVATRVRQAAETFTNWLKEASDDEEEE